ncbi:MAG: glycosyl transferase family 36, partial [Desulfobacterota bacterium]|nr:glycosyl transferase family 36 [Thermodesulfobacteriota bacterium]
ERALSAPDPTWYNQDGAIRTTVATIKSLTLAPDDFRFWSLQVFTNLLVYDWFRVLIWFDHMGLRVATLVNLSFVGGDLVDEKAARSLGYSVRTRWIPEGVRRFATWAPLLIPFFIPRGKEWDIVWSQYENLRKIHPTTTLPPGTELIGVGIFLVFALTLFLFLQNQGKKRARVSSLDNLLLTNGIYTAKFLSNGRGYSRTFSLIRKGEELDLTRQPADPLWLCGKFFYLLDRELPAKHPHCLWSLAYSPMGRVGTDYQVTRLDPLSLKISHTFNSILSTAVLSLGEDDSVEIWQITLHNLANRSRVLELTSYRELVMNVHGAFWRHPIFNNLHVVTWFVRPLNAIIARNSLLKDLKRDSKKRSRSRETAFHAVQENRKSGVVLIGYEDCRSYFLGHQTLRMPEGLNKPLRSPGDEGFLYSFSPIASLRLRIELPPKGKVMVRFLDGYA